MSQWYLVCGVYNIYFCNRMDIFDIGMGATKELYEAELDALLAYAEAPCGSQRFDCFLATNCFDASQTDIEAFNDMWRSKRTGSSVRVPSP